MLLITGHGLKTVEHLAGRPQFSTRDRREAERVRGVLGGSPRGRGRVGENGHEHVQGADPQRQVGDPRGLGGRGARRRRRRAPSLVDVRETDEWAQGHVPGAVFIPRGFLELRIEEKVPDKCGGGRPLLRGRHPQRVRRAHPGRARLPQRVLDDRRLRPLEGGRLPDRGAGRGLTAEQQQRYSRHLLVPEVGEAGQARLLDVEGAARRRGRPRLAGRALPRRRRRRHDRHRRLGRGRPLEPAAPGAAHRRPAWASPRPSRPRPRSAPSTPT